MNSLDSNNPQAIDVIVIGGGPAGLSAATMLKSLGIERVVILEREAEAGGIPRHCGHPPFGLREFKRIYTGPEYATQLLKKALLSGVEVHTGVTVIEMRPDAHLLISDTYHGQQEISARRVLYATGARETPRSTRLVSGKRPLGIMNTGALQSLVYLGRQRPFKNPVIIGSELVSFSAIQTCRHAKIKPAAMIEASSSIIAPWPSGLFAKLMRVPLHLCNRLVSIEGDTRVDSVTIENAAGVQQILACDGVIFSGNFTPESSLARSSHLLIDSATGGPIVNQYGQCSDICYYAAGNVLRAVETSGWSWEEGRQIAAALAADLKTDKRTKQDTLAEDIRIVISSPLIRYCVPQKLNRQKENAGLKQFQLRFSKNVCGELIIKNNDHVLWRKRIKAHREGRILIPINPIIQLSSKIKLLTLDFCE